MAQRLVKFPLAGSECRLGTVSVNDLGDSDGDKLLANGGPNVFHLGKDDEVEKIVRAARANEKDLKRSGRKVAVDLHDFGDNPVHGESYGLALAVADYLSRYPDLAVATADRKDGIGPRVVATGTVGEHGRIGPISYLERKLACIETLLGQGALNSGDFFFYPKANEVGPEEPEALILGRLSDLGLRCLTVDGLGSVKSFLSLESGQSAEAIAESRSSIFGSRKPARYWWPLVVVAFLVAMAVLLPGSIDKMLQRGADGGSGNGSAEGPSAGGSSVALSDASPTTSLATGANAPLTFTLNDMGMLNADVAVKFRYGGDDGKARPFRTGAKPALVSGERFTVYVRSNRDTYLYLIHFDTLGQVRMLLAEDREGAYTDPDERNRLRAGDELILPGENRHYRLDDIPGRESFHIVVSPMPLADLKAAYETELERKRGETEGARRAARGIGSVLTPMAGFESPATDATTPGRGIAPSDDPDRSSVHAPIGALPHTNSLTCLAPSETCRGNFFFEHIGAD